TDTPPGKLPIAHFNRKAIDMNDPEPARALALAVIEQARISEHPERERERVQFAMPLVEHALAAHSDDLPAWETKANGFFLLGRYEEALAACEHVLLVAPRRETALVGAAAIARALGQSETEYGYWKRLLDLNPTSLSYRVGLANNLVKRNQWPEA